MGSYRAEAQISAPAHRVWDVLVDLQRWPVWTKSVRTLRRLDQSEFGMGSKVRITQPVFGTSTWVVDEWQPQSSFTWTSSKLGVRSVAQHRIVAIAPGQVKVVLTIQQTGRFADLVERYFGKKIERYMRLEAEGLRRSLQGT